MSRPERCTAPAADAASVLEHELRRLFQQGEVSEIDRRRLLKLSRALTAETNRLHDRMGLVAAAMCADSVDASSWKRKHREYQQNWSPEPTTPAHSKRAA